MKAQGIVKKSIMSCAPLQVPRPPPEPNKERAESQIEDEIEFVA